MTYEELIARITTTAVIDSPTGDPDFITMIPSMIDHAEGLIYRDIDFFFLRKSIEILAASDSNIIEAPQDLILWRSVFMKYPFDGTKRFRLSRKDSTFLNVYWPDPTLTDKPKYWAELTPGITSGLRGTIKIAPTPDLPITLVVEYTERPAPLSAPNFVNYLVLNYPELMFAACMIFVTGYMKNFGAQSDDPKMAQSWQNQYELLKAGVIVEESRRRSLGVMDISQNGPKTS